MTPPDPDEYAPAFGAYIRRVPPGDVQVFLTAQLDDLLSLLCGLSASQSLQHHAPYTWSIKQVLGHITDTERVFAHRVLWIARNSPTPLAAFDEKDFMKFANFDSHALAELLEAFEHLRRSNLLLFSHLDAEACLRRGVVNDHPASARAFIYAIAGHTQHHLDILHSRLGCGKN